MLPGIPRRHKVVFLGPSAGGKTSIIQRYAKGNFIEQQPTIGTAFYSRDVDTTRGRILLNIWDTAGMERYKSLVPKYTKGASAAVVVFDVTDPSSYSAAKDLLTEAPENSETDLITFFVGNKIDLGCGVDRAEVDEFVNSQHTMFFETSAQTGENVCELFREVAEQLSSIAGTQTGLQLPMSEITPPSSGCC
jgi:small GTP-binding protein